ncbi:tyrosine-type recombinase/integrase [Variovorax sp. NFACC27]|uniref:Tyrosine-type recombinase/integrase n=1 Tax=Variovorax paradoxus TaxID=34073 RepID=A0A5Q0LXG3_VARPD|nr:tyrosine-type recombinase/integrase [Variovorax paradoxus]SEF19329.1 Site-specific recombinase XerD [Variovorax sp. NFACC28]SEF73978.1 Site-specific recombinase XerD [Variovorax sp. NFACC29]SFB78090.1 Site-specific recombinase XerD [Variovorax sp. NFACC26]SFG77489.1 Site-specific recombinase XerD [Variovorax sp. NFACC27]QFZ81886.1 tyrosine-type recombinase/integrase [Variovorax paradoxus]
MKAETTLQATVQRYLKERRQLGFALKAPATELMRFARFADARGHKGPLTRELQVEWARQHVHRTDTVTAARRIEILRPFAAYYRQFEVDTEVLPTNALGRGHRRLTPHIYTNEEILQLLRYADGLAPLGGLRPLMYRTLFGLLAAVGLRISEALKLRVGDIDLDVATITVRETKFHKSRCLPIHASVVQALMEYRHMRDRHADSDADAPFFVSRIGGFLPASTAEHVFKRLRPRLGWCTRGDHTNPRLHDLRHTMAVRRVQLWHETGVSIDQAMFWLCTYLGHAKITDTYWYLTGVPELMDIVGAKFERFSLAGDGDE